MECMHEGGTPDKDIRQDPCVRGLLSRMPEKVGSTLTDEQLFCLKNALGAQRGRRHRLDLRGSFGLWQWRYYWVFLAGRERRQLSRKELRTVRTARAVLVGVLLLVVIGGALAALYFLNSGRGIDLLSGQGSGLWKWLRTRILQ